MPRRPRHCNVSESCACVSKTFYSINQQTSFPHFRQRTFTFCFFSFLFCFTFDTPFSHLASRLYVIMTFLPGVHLLLCPHSCLGLRPQPPGLETPVLDLICHIVWMLRSPPCVCRRRIGNAARDSLYPHFLEYLNVRFKALLERPCVHFFRYLLLTVLDRLK